MWYNVVMDDKLEFHKWSERYCTYDKHWVDTKNDNRKWYCNTCPDCRQKQNKKIRQRLGSEYVRNYNRFYRYGLSEERCNELLIKQEGLCLICLQPLEDDIAVDEIPGVKPIVIRGLLHKQCNLDLGVIEKYRNLGYTGNINQYLSRTYE